MTWDGQNAQAGTIKLWDGVKVVEVPLPQGLPEGGAAGQVVRYDNYATGPAYGAVSGRSFSTYLVPTYGPNIDATGLYYRGGSIVFGDVGDGGYVGTLRDARKQYTHVVYEPDTDRLYAVYQDLDLSGAYVGVLDGLSVDAPPALSSVTALLTAPPGSNVAEDCLRATGGGGFLWLFISVPNDRLLKVDATTLNTLADTSSFSPNVFGLHFDPDDGKYGDGLGRVYINTMGGQFRFTENLVGNYFGAYPTIDGNTFHTAVWSGSFTSTAQYFMSQYTSGLYVCRTALEPVFSAPSYAALLENSGAWRPGGVAFDETLGRGALLYGITAPGTSAKIVVFEDTGSALNVLNTIVLPPEVAAGCAVGRSAPECFAEGGKVYIINNDVTGAGVGVPFNVFVVDLATALLESTKIPSINLQWSEASVPPSVAETVLTFTQVLPSTGPLDVTYLVDSNSGSITLIAPPTPSPGMCVTLVDVGGVASSNTITFSGTVVGPSVLNVDNGARTWRWDDVNSQWLCVGSS